MRSNSRKALNRSLIDYDTDVIVHGTLAAASTNSTVITGMTAVAYGVH